MYTTRCFVGLMLAASILRGAEPPPAWQTDWNTAFAKAREEHRLVFVDYTAGDCGECHDVERLTFGSPEILQHLADFVLLRVDIKRRKIPSAHQVTDLPAFVVFDPAQRERLRIAGKGAGSYLTIRNLDEIHRAAPAFLKAADLLDAKQDLEATLLVADTYSRLKMEARARAAYAEARKLAQQRGDSAAVRIAEARMAQGSPAPAASAVAAPALFELPAPTGPFAVGTTSWLLTDPARKETLSAEGGDRQVEVVAWYPAGSGAAAPAQGAPAPYLREGPAEVENLARRLGAPTAFAGLAAVRTHGRPDAEPAAARAGKFPVLVFSHGYTGIPSSYTAFLEDLASHGYAVLSVVHPYEAGAATLEGGRVATLLDASGELRKPIRDVLGEWGAEDATMAEVTAQTDDEARLRTLRKYLAMLPQTDAALRRWVDDTKLVLDRLAGLSPATPAGRLAARLDLARVGVFGHSMGGVTAGQFCAEDRRCKAGLNLDGIPQYGTMIDHSLRPPFLMVYSARPGRTGASDAIYRRGASPYVRVDVRDTLHLDFSDMVFWGGPLRERPILGKLAPGRIAEITRAIVREFFDQQLLGKRSKLLAGEAIYPEVTVHTFRDAPAATH